MIFIVNAVTLFLTVVFVVLELVLLWFGKWSQLGIMAIPTLLFGTIFYSLNNQYINFLLAELKQNIKDEFNSFKNFKG